LSCRFFLLISLHSLLLILQTIFKKNSFWVSQREKEVEATDHVLGLKGVDLKGDPVGNTTVGQLFFKVWTRVPFVSHPGRVLGNREYGSPSYPHTSFANVRPVGKICKRNLKNFFSYFSTFRRVIMQLFVYFFLVWLKR